MKQKLLYLAVLVGCCFEANLTQAQVVRIEEDWVVQIAVPDQPTDAPQITTTMAPFPNSNLQFQVNINHAQGSEFVAGGVQVRALADDQTIQEVHKHPNVRLTQTGEVIHWTTAIHKHESGYWFGLVGGSGQTWGQLGGVGWYISAPNNSDAPSLEQYHYQRSIDQSEVGYAGHRVHSLKLLRVRVYYANGYVAQHQINTTIHGVDDTN
jgi:hypothetical protein